MKPNFSFCGYPVPDRTRDLDPDTPLQWHPCGELATEGCCYCEKHAVWPEAKPLTEQDIVDRAENRAHYIHRAKMQALFLTVAFVTVLVALLQPVHSWLQAHLEFLGGVLAGSVVTGTWWGMWRWQKGDRP